jgi:uncharacterized protein YgiM (DUF1202 family)
MDKKIGLLGMIGISLVAAFILSSCSTAILPASPVIQVVSPSALDQANSGTEVATDTPAEAATAAPTATNTVTPTVAPSVVPTEATTATTQMAAQVVPTFNAYCRKGPGAGYHAITFLLKGTTYNVIGRDSLSSWWQIEAPGKVNCWVMDTSVNKQGAVEQAPIVQGQPLPGTPALYVSSYVCDLTMKTLGVTLNWAAVANATNYRIYRNGIQLIDVGSDVTTYHDVAPLGVTLLYELEAFNDYGVAPRISTSVQACE